MQQGSTEWHDARDKCAITWSCAANALGIGYTSRIKYMKQKLGLEPKDECNWRMAEGTKREPWAAELYYRVMGFCGERVQLDTDGFRNDPSDWRLGGSPDRIVTDPKTGERWLLEIKTCPGGDMRTEIPVSHLLQMHGLCHTYGLSKAHYFCWSQSQGCLIAEITWDERLWDRVLYPRYKTFADLWSVRALPERMTSEEKEFLIGSIQRFSHIQEISCVRTKRQKREQQQKLK